MSMTAWQMVAAGEPMRKAELPLPSPGPGEVRVRVAGCGVCHTDLGFYYDGVRTKSTLPLTLGHEISGLVEAAGDGAERWLDKAVIIPAVMPCGDCDLCKRGLGNICRAQKMPGNDIQGGFASHVLVPAAGLCEVPGASPEGTIGQSGVELADLSIIADALTTPYQAISESGLGPEDMAVFVGVGGVGGFGAQIARALGACVAAVDVDPERLDALAPYVDRCFNARDFPGRELRRAIGALAEEQGRRQTEWKIFETSGTAAGQKTAFGLLTFGAYLAVVGFTMEAPEIRLSNLMAFHATARGNWGCLPAHYPAALELVLAGKVKIGPFVERFPLDSINEVFERVHGRELKIRPILVP
ncbi:MAG: 6-hydroxycyclohex-1-ene-1-carbonyl-CoA dehydrogenase [Deltaproteobacteria bacterium]|nr:6-hydroxycyclohex-1-ene-1-carbonyl-CoA dehydrogenase [Deltaproteobacteria bacterium]